MAIFQNLGKPVPGCLYLDFIEAKDDGGGGDNWNCKMGKAPVKLSPSTNQQPTSYRLDALTVYCHPTNSVKH